MHSYVLEFVQWVDDTETEVAMMECEWGDVHDDP